MVNDYKRLKTAKALTNKAYDLFSDFTYI